MGDALKVGRTVRFVYPGHDLSKDYNINVIATIKEIVGAKLYRVELCDVEDRVAANDAYYNYVSEELFDTNGSSEIHSFYLQELDYIEEIVIALDDSYE